MADNLLLTIISPNMLKTFNECQKKYFFKYVERVQLPQKASIFEKGKKIHALANYCLNGANISKMERSLNAEECELWEALKNNKYFNLEVFNTEYNLSCKIDNYWIGGRIDAIVKDGNDYYILDYKTGNIPQNAEYDLQTIVYLLCADKYFKNKGDYNTLKFVYLGLKKGVEKEIILSDSLKAEYEQIIIESCKKLEFALNSTVYEKSKTCETCEYKKLCN